VTFYVFLNVFTRFLELWLRPRGRCPSSSSAHGHKCSRNRLSLPHLWQSLCIRFRIKESPSVPSSITDQLAHRHRRLRQTTPNKQATMGIRSVIE